MVKYKKLTIEVEIKSIHDDPVILIRKSIEGILDELMVEKTIMDYKYDSLNIKISK